MKTEPIRVLMAAHGHPSIARGGGEVAAYNLHLGLRAEPGFDSVLLARHERDELLHGGTPFAGNGRPGEILFHATMPDWFRFSQPDKARIWRDFREALETARPHVVHFHHYLFFGLEAIREVRAWNPGARVVLTLHEYFALCHNHGQMVTPGARALCHESTPSACARCFPQHTVQDFTLRREFIRSHFDLVDRFVAPSEFLKGRYVEWGLDANRIDVIENVLDPAARARSVEAATAAPTSARPDAPVRLAYFGQVNAFKGLDVLLDALVELPDEIRTRLTLDVNGHGLERQAATYRKRVEKALARLGDTVRLRGGYRQDELGKLMAASDWMVMPSRWWENSPMVIQEAASHGLPVIASDLGGMAEKIDDGLTGLHFLAGRPEALAERLVEVATDRSLRARFSAELARRTAEAGDAHFAAHVAMYRKLTVADRSSDDVAAFEPRRAA